MPSKICVPRGGVPYPSSSGSTSCLCFLDTIALREPILALSTLETPTLHHAVVGTATGRVVYCALGLSQKHRPPVRRETLSRYTGFALLELAIVSSKRSAAHDENTTKSSCAGVADHSVTVYAVSEYVAGRIAVRRYHVGGGGSISTSGSSTTAPGIQPRPTEDKPRLDEVSFLISVDGIELCCGRSLFTCKKNQHSVLAECVEAAGISNASRGGGLREGGLRAGAGADYVFLWRGRRGGATSEKTSGTPEVGKQEVPPPRQREQGLCVLSSEVVAPATVVSSSPAAAGGGGVVNEDDDLDPQKYEGASSSLDDHDEHEVWLSVVKNRSPSALVREVELGSLWGRGERHFGREDHALARRTTRRFANPFLVEESSSSYRIPVGFGVPQASPCGNANAPSDAARGASDAPRAASDGACSGSLYYTLERRTVPNLNLRIAAGKPPLVVLHQWRIMSESDVVGSAHGREGCWATPPEETPPEENVGLAEGQHRMSALFGGGAAAGSGGEAKSRGGGAAGIIGFFGDFSRGGH